jgi:hypothetical protein
LLQALARWLWAAAVGAAMGGAPAALYVALRGGSAWGDRLAIVALVGLGLGLAQMALLATLLHEDALAANPFMVLRAIARIGGAYVAPCLVTAAFAWVGGVLVVLSLRWIRGPLIVAPLFAICVYSVYATLVAFRVLGLCYHRHRARVGWFQEKQRWGVRG